MLHSRLRRAPGSGLRASDAGTGANVLRRPIRIRSGSMRIKLDYGTTGLEIDLPDDNVTVIEPVYRAPAPDPHQTLLAAMRAPIDSRPLPALVKAGQRIAISVCDITRAQPRRETLDAIFDELPDVR